MPLDVGPNLITIVVTASDGSTAPHTYRVTVTRAPNTPPVFDEGAAATRGVDENIVANTVADSGANRDIGDPLRATDADSADTLTYSLDTASEAFFDIDATTGQLRTEAALDHETRKSYPVEVSVSDGKDANGDADPSADDTITVTVLISDVTEGASFGSVDPTRTIAENTPAGVPLGAPFQATDGDGDTLTYSLGANNLGGTTWSTSRSTRPPASCGPGQPWTTKRSSRTRWVSPPRRAPSTTSSWSPSPSRTWRSRAWSRCRACSPGLARRCSPTLTDPDVVSGAVTWAWERSTSRTSSWTTIDGAASASYRTDDADADHYLRATASYVDGEDAGKSASVVSANPVRALAPGNNDPSFTPAPVARTVDENELAGTIVGAPDTRTVDENELAGTIVGAPFVATDADHDDDTLTYFLSGTDAAAFEIDSSSGQLRTRTVLDFETRQSYQVTVTATDPSGGFGEVTVTITVGNVQEPGTVRLSLLEPVVGARLTATLVDPDEVSGSVTWLWESSPDRGVLDPRQRSHIGGQLHVHAGGRRCGRLSAGHRLLRRWSRRQPGAPRRSRPTPCGSRGEAARRSSPTARAPPATPRRPRLRG